MARISSLPLFVDDFEAATAHLTVEEDGAYNRLLRLCWRTPGCSVPDDKAWIARHMRVDSETFDRLVEPIIEEFFQRENGRVFQKRLSKEFSYVTKVSVERKKAGRKGGVAKAMKNNGNESSKATDLPEQSGSKTVAPTPTPTPTPTFKEDVVVVARAREADRQPPPTSEPTITNLPDDAVALYEAVRKASGVPDVPLPTYWMPHTAIIEVARWRGLGLTDEEIIEVARNCRRNKTEPPQGPRALERFMAIAASVKVNRRTLPAAGGARNDGNADRRNEELRRIVAAGASPDKGLDFW